MRIRFGGVALLVLFSGFVLYVVVTGAGYGVN